MLQIMRAVVKQYFLKKPFNFFRMVFYLRYGFKIDEQNGGKERKLKMAKMATRILTTTKKLT